MVNGGMDGIEGEGRGMECGEGSSGEGGCGRVGIGRGETLIVEDEHLYT